MRCKLHKAVNTVKYDVREVDASLEKMSTEGSVHTKRMRRHKLARLSSLVVNSAANIKGQFHVRNRTV